MMLLCAAIPAVALPGSIDFGTKLNLFATKASMPDSLFDDYKAGYLKLDINFAYHIIHSDFFS